MSSPEIISAVRTMMKKDDNWLEKMTSPQLEILAKLNPDLTETTEEYAPGRTRTIVQPEFRNRYVLYSALRKKRRCPKNQHGEAMLKTMKE